MGYGIGKNRDFSVHFGVNLRLQTSSFWRFAQGWSFVFNELVASVVSKNNLFPCSPAFPFRHASRLPPTRRLIRTPGSE
jgi:hypothetical protein